MKKILETIKSGKSLELKYNGKVVVEIHLEEVYYKDPIETPIGFTVVRIEADMNGSIALNQRVRRVFKSLKQIDDIFKMFAERFEFPNEEYDLFECGANYKLYSDLIKDLN